MCWNDATRLHPTFYSTESTSRKTRRITMPLTARCSKWSRRPTRSPAPRSLVRHDKILFSGAAGGRRDQAESSKEKHFTIIVNIFLRCCLCCGCLRPAGHILPNVGSIADSSHDDPFSGAAHYDRMEWASLHWHPLLVT